MCVCVCVSKCALRHVLKKSKTKTNPSSSAIINYTSTIHACMNLSTDSSVPASTLNMRKGLITLHSLAADSTEL